MSGLPIGIPSLDEIEEKTRNVLGPMKEIMEIREGRRGQKKRQRFLTFQDLIDVGLKTENEIDAYLEDK